MATLAYHPASSDGSDHRGFTERDAFKYVRDETETDGERERQRDRETATDTAKRIERERNIETDRQRDRYVEKES